MDFLRKLWQCFFCWHVAPEKNKLKLFGAEVILAQSFGGRDGGPGKSNEALAMVAFYASRISDALCLPLVLQWEIDACFPGAYVAGVIHQHRQSGKYLDTREVLAQSWEICQQPKHAWLLPGKAVNQPWVKAIVVAHQDHLWRVMRAAEKLGFEVMAAATASVPYDKESKQWWTRSRGRFVAREIPTRLYYWWRGWI